MNISRSQLFRLSVCNKMVKAKAFIYANHFQGWPKDSDLKLVEEELPPIKNGEFLSQAVFLSVDPYMRVFAPRLPTGITFIGEQVAKVIDSKNPKYPVGVYVIGQFGWRTHTITDPSDKTNDLYKKIFGETEPVRVLPPLGDLSPSLALGVLGMPGNTAFFGYFEILKPKTGNTVVVSGAAGAVGSLVGQFAKMNGCKVIGIAGSDEKGKWLKDELHFDEFINYKTQNVKDALKQAAPKGVDCYYDNVGGEISSIVIHQMNPFGRIAVCGGVAEYNETTPPKAEVIQHAFVGKQLTMQGLVVTRWNDRWNQGIEQNMKWVKEGKLKYRETITDGFENIPKAFTDMLKGGNTGKAIVRV